MAADNLAPLVARSSTVVALNIQDTYVIFVQNGIISTAQPQCSVYVKMYQMFPNINPARQVLKHVQLILSKCRIFASVKAPVWRQAIIWTNEE